MSRKGVIAVSSDGCGELTEWRRVKVRSSSSADTWSHYKLEYWSCQWIGRLLVWSKATFIRVLFVFNTGC